MISLFTTNKKRETILKNLSNSIRTLIKSIFLMIFNSRISPSTLIISLTIEKGIFICSIRGMTNMFYNKMKITNSKIIMKKYLLSTLGIIKKFFHHSNQKFQILNLNLSHNKIKFFAKMEI
jgi:hypothetical protein